MDYFYNRYFQAKTKEEKTRYFDLYLNRYFSKIKDQEGFDERELDYIFTNDYYTWMQKKAKKLMGYDMLIQMVTSKKTKTFL